jgi:DNA-directed RNA polymerase subunit H (RpoH/RPB5)
MSSTSSNRILSIYKSRKTILDLLDYQDYLVEDYTGFSINETDAMFVNSQLDLLVSHKKNPKKVYVKYLISSKVRAKDLDDIIEDLMYIENVLQKSDTIIIIMDDEPNDSITAKLKYLYDHDGIFVVIHNIARLQFNILEHVLNPQVVVLEEKSETDKLMKKYNLKSLTQLPEIDRFDPLALALCLRPGQVCEMQRGSATALSYKYYRICV